MKEILEQKRREATLCYGSMIVLWIVVALVMLLEASSK
jgi:hypothetical protein